MVPKLLRRLPALVPTLTQPAYGGAYVTGYSGVYDITEDWYPIVGEEELTATTPASAAAATGSSSAPRSASPSPP